MGGFIFDMEGRESHQMDVIITNDTTPRFDLHNKDGSGKSFSPVEPVGAVSIKSTLDGAELKSALLGIASIPPTSPLDGRLLPLAQVEDYDDWPLKVIYASKGISAKKLFMHLFAFYHLRPHIRINRRPNIIHVAGEYVMLRTARGMVDVGAQRYGHPSWMKEGNYHHYQN